MKYHSCQYYIQRYYIYLSPTLYSPNYISKDLVTYTPLSFIASALEALFQLLAYLL